MAVLYGKNYGKPTLDLNFAGNKSLVDTTTEKNYVTFSRAQSGNEVTYIGSDGLIKYAAADEARFDHDPVTLQSLGLLIEESRTNYVEDNDQVMVNRDNCTPTQTTGPDGVSTSASRLTAIASGFTNASNATNRTITWSADVITTWSFYFNPANTTATTIDSGAAAGSGIGGATFEWSTLTATPNPSKPDVIGAGIVYVGNGWYRAWTIYDDTISSSAGCRFSVSFTAVAAGESIDVFGQMVEEGSFPTSYIPTSGSTVTRSADVASITGDNFSSWYNQSASTVLMEYTIRNGSSNSSNYLELFGFTYNNSFGGHFSGRIDQGSSIRTLSQNNNARVNLTVNDGVYKSCHGIVENTSTNKTISISVNGSAVNSSTVSATAVTHNLFKIGDAYGGNTILSNPIARLTYYPKRLPDIELQQLTK